MKAKVIIVHNLEYIFSDVYIVITNDEICVNYLLNRDHYNLHIFKSLLQV